MTGSSPVRLLRQPQHLSQLTAFPPAANAVARIHPERVAAKVRSQPTVAERAGPAHLKTAQPNLHAVRGIRGIPGYPGKAHGGEALFRFIEYLQRLPPRRLVLIVDLAQVQNRVLGGFAARQPPVLDDAEVPMEVPIDLAVFMAIGCCAARKLAQVRRSG